MRFVRVVCIVLALALSCSVARAACTRNESGVFEDIPCASEAFKFADSELKAIYKHLMQSLDAPGKKALLQSQRSWLKFLDANADFIYAIEGDGADGRLVVINSREEYTRLRSKELQGWKIHPSPR